MIITGQDPRTLGQEYEGVFILPTTREKEKKREAWRASLVQRAEQRKKEKKK